MTTKQIVVGPVVIVLAIVLAAMPGQVMADGGDVRLSTVLEGRRITAFTSPSPLRAGNVDVSVLVQDAATGALQDDLAATVKAFPIGSDLAPIEVLAAHEAATNKLLRSARFELPSAGRWRMEVVISDRGNKSCAAFDVVAAEPLPPWDALWMWIASPVIPIALYTLGEVRRQRRRANRSPAWMGGRIN